MSGPDRYALPRRLDPGRPSVDELAALIPRWGVRAAWVTVVGVGAWLFSLIGALVPFGGGGQRLY